MIDVLIPAWYPDAAKPKVSPDLVPDITLEQPTADAFFYAPPQVNNHR